MAVASVACFAGCDAPNSGEIFHQLLGGDTTVHNTTKNAFDFSARNLTEDEKESFEIGDSFFERNWVTAPATTEARDGLGPTFNAKSCSSCHLRDGRAKPPDDDNDLTRGLLFRLSVPGPEGPAPLEAYASQLQDDSITNVEAEGRMVIRYQETQGQYADGTPYSLRAPSYAIDEPFAPLPSDLMISPRIAPAIIGMGLLEAIPENTILAMADPDDADGDGISGSANNVWDIRGQSKALGRFGWKANQPSVEQQVAAAFNGDIGITSSLFPHENCPEPQTACAEAANGGSPELSDERLGNVTLYSQSLAVPAMRNFEDPVVRQGADLFVSTGCAACHVPKHVTGEHPIAAMSHQTIYPYTDLLLHDMGDGLADGRPDFEANGNEWRTPPLWGIGLVDEVNGHTMFLHDGRARSLEEAILWHGGEAQASRDNFTGLSLEERKALLFFLESL